MKGWHCSRCGGWNHINFWLCAVCEGGLRIEAKRVSHSHPDQGSRPSPPGPNGGCRRTRHFTYPERRPDERGSC